MEHLLTSAAGVIGNSQATLNELAAFAAASKAPMPPHVAALIGGYRESSSVHPRSLPEPYFVIVGTIEGRKNHLLLLQIWRRLVADLGEKAPTLVILGQRGWQADSALAMLDNLADLERHVVELGHCDDDQLACWMAGAKALLMPSFTEGFGLPIIEALQLSTPVIASDLPVYREIAGDIPTYLDPCDGAAWEHAIREFMNDQPERLHQLARMKDYHAPDWPTHFATVENWLENLDRVRRSVETCAV